MLDVLVVGAGPTGLMMAAELARYGLSCRIIDENDGPCEQSRAIGIQARTLEIFDHIGIVAPFLKNGLILKAVNPMSRGKRIAHIELGRLDSPYPFVLSLEQSSTEKILANHLSSFGVNIERRTELVSLVQDAKGASAILRQQTSGKEETVRSAWVVGCDGAHSIVRRSMHLSFEGKTFEDIFSLADVQILWKYPHDEVFAFPGAEGVIAALPLPGKDRYRVIFQLPRCRGLLSAKKPMSPEEIARIPPPRLDEITAMLRNYAEIDVQISDPRWMAHFHINSRMASSFREGRFFLAGDAAHIHSPVGAQGMNTGLQDAFNLAWKLAFVVRGEAPAELLDTYNLERHEFGKKLLKWTERGSQMVTLHNPLLVSMRNRILSWILSCTSIQKKIISAISQIAIRYPASQIVQSGANAGTRLPNASVVYKGASTDLYTLLRKPNAYSILWFSNREVSLKDQTHVFKIPSDREEAYIIRPDLYIAYFQTPIDASALEQAVLKLSHPLS